MKYTDGSTTSLIRHLKRKHDIEIGSFKKIATTNSSSSQTTTTTKQEYLAKKAKLNEYPPRKQLINKPISKMILDLQPTSFTKDIAFRELI